MTTIALVGASRSVPEGLEAALPDDRIIRVEQPGPIERAGEVEIALGPGSSPQLIRDVVEQASRLRWLHITSAGVNLALMPEVVGRANLVVTNNSGSFDVQVSEFAITLMLAAAKRLPDYQRAQQGAQWDRTPQSAELHGAVLLVLGLGSIGSELARLASAFGMRVIGLRRRADAASVPGVSAVVGPERLAHVVSEADYVAITAALTPETRGLVSRDILARMKRTAWIINVARGEIIDEAALFDAVREQRIGGAALDVWWKEPIPADSKWWHLPNVIVTPHAASSSPRLRKRTQELFLENLRRWKAGQPLLNVVDRQAGY